VVNQKENRGGLMSDTLVIENQTDHTPLKQYFGITDSYDTGFGDDLDFITSWAKEKGLNRENMLLEIKKVEQRLGSPMPGENRYHRVKHYLSLDQKLGNTLKEMAAHERAWKEMV
jgi:hypothetical protein